MVLSRITQPTTMRLFGFAVGCHDFSLISQRMKYQSGFRQFRKWSCGETNLIQTGTLLSKMSLSPSPSRSLSTVFNYGIGHRQKQYFQSNTSRGLQNRCYCEFNPFTKIQYERHQQVIGGAIQNTQKSPLDIQKPVAGAGNSQPSILGKRERPQDSPSDSHESDPKRQALGDVRNMGTIIVADPALKISGEQQYGERESSSDLAVEVEHEMKGDGEYVVSIKRVTGSSTTEEDKVERAKQMAEKAAVLLLYGEMLLQMGNKLRAQSRASLYSVFDPPAPSISQSDVE